MKKQFFKKALAAVLATVMAFQIFPLRGMAAPVAPPDLSGVVSPTILDESKESATPILEDESRRGINEKHVLLSDGSWLGVGYAQNVHYQGNGKGWLEIDNTLEDQGDHYAPKANGIGIELPKELGGDNKATMTLGEFQLAIGMPVPTKAQENPPAEGEVVDSAVDEIEDETEAVTEPAEPETIPAETEATEAEAVSEAADDAETETTSEAETEEDVLNPAPVEESTTAAEETSAVATSVETTDAAVLDEAATAADADESVEASVASGFVLDLNNGDAAKNDITVVENLNSGLVYPDAFTGADVQFVLQSDQLENNVIVKSAGGLYSYDFTLDMQNMVAVPQDIRTIHLLDAATGELKFVITAPCAIDAAGQINEEALSLSLNDGILTLAADPAWMNAPDRVFPVVLDPVYGYVTDWDTLEVASINSRYGRYNRFISSLHVGNADGNISRSLLKFKLPSLPNSGVITTAKLSLTPKSSEKLNIGAYRVLNQWYDDEVTWNSGIAIDDMALSIGEFLVDDNLYQFDVTQAAKQWYENGKGNFGVMLKALDENVAGEVKFTAPQNLLGLFLGGIAHALPAVVVHYVNNVGQEGYWSSEPIDMGDSGTAYVTQYSGGLTYVHPDVVLQGQRMPLVLSHNYVSAHENLTGNYLNMKFGVGFRLSLMEEIMPGDANIISKSGTYAMIDGDGTVHYFMESETEPGVFENEINRTIRLTQEGGKFVIRDEQENRKVYTEMGTEGHFYLTEIHDANGNKTEIKYQAGQIVEIIDTIGRTIKLTYDSDGRLTQIIDPTLKVTEFTYEELTTEDERVDVLKAIAYSDSRTTEFKFAEKQDTNDRLALQTHLDVIKNADNQLYKFTYSRFQSSGRTGHRVSEVQMGTGKVTKTLLKEAPVPVEEGDESVGALGKLGWIGQVFITISKAVFWIVSQLVNMSSWAVDIYGRWYRVRDKPDLPNGEEWEQIVEWDQLIYTLSFAYDLSKTEIKSSLSPETRVYLFNSWGLTVAASTKYDEHEDSAFAGYTSETGAKNLPEYSASAIITRNLLKNPSGEYDDSSWTAGFLGGLLQGTTNMVNDGFAGLRAWELNGKAKQSQSVTLPAGTYTLSAYSKDGKGRLGYDFKDVQGFTETEYVADAASQAEVDANKVWQRYATTFTITKQTKGTVYIEAVSDTVLFDALQLEQNGGANAFNYVENNDFSKGSALWEVKNGTSGDKIANGKYVIHGAPDKEKALAQEVKLFSAKGQMVTFGAKASANAVGSEFKVYAEFYDGGNKIGEESVDFITDIRNKEQTAAISYPLPADCTHMLLFVCYYNQATGEMNALKVSDTFVFVGTDSKKFKYTDGKMSEIATKDGAMDVEYDPANDANIKSVEAVVADGEDATNSVKNSVEYEYVGTTSNVKAEKNYKDGVLISETEYTYDSWGLPSSIVVTADDGVQTRQKITYTSDYNNIATETDVNGLVTKYFYDQGLVQNVVTRVEGPDGSVYNYDYDDAEKLLESVQSGTSKNEYSYTDKGLLGSLTHGTTTYAFDYNQLGQVVESKVGSTAIVTNKYDDQYRLKEAVYGNGTGYRPGYDVRGRLVGDYYSDAAGNYQLSFGYIQDNEGRLSQVVNHETQRTTQFMYDLKGQQTSVYTADSNGKNASRVRMDYEGSSLAVLKESGPDGILSQTQYTYDDLSRPETAGMLSLGGVEGGAVRYGYTGINLLLMATHILPKKDSNDPNEANEKVTTTLGYKDNEVGSETYGTNIVEQMTTTLPDDVEFTYLYEYNGPNISKVTANGVETEYAYGANGQLVKDGGTFYTYDASGNMLTISGAESHTLTYGNPNWKDQLTMFGDEAITYDAMGNLTNYDDRTYTWAKGKQLVGIKGAGPDVSYKYEFTGLRNEKKVGNKTTRYNWANGLLMSQTDGKDTIAWSHNAAGQAIAFSYDGEAYFYIRNLQGDVIGIYDVEGKVVAEYKYDAWGNILSVTGSNMAVANANPIRYRGYYWDSETNFYYCSTRYYNPLWRRWISSDMIFDTQDSVLGTNMYVYSLNNPVMNCDPSGMISWTGNGVGGFFAKLGHTILDIGSFIGSAAFTLTLFPLVVLPLAWAAKGISKLIDSTLPGLNWKSLWFWVDMRYPSFLGSNCLFRWLGWDTGFGEGIDNFNSAHFFPLFLFLGGGIFLQFWPWGSDDFNGDVNNGTGAWHAQTSWFLQIQRIGGYNNGYDDIFKIGSSCQNARFTFKDGLIWYRLWCWKGDYYNLGAGTEFGLYYALRKNAYHWQTVYSGSYLSVDMKITIRDDNGIDNLVYPINPGDKPPDNWWVCTFLPAHQAVLVEDIGVFAKIGFHRNGMIDAFVAEPENMRDRRISIDGDKVVFDWYAGSTKD